MFPTHHIAKCFAAALIPILTGSAPSLAKPMWADPAPIPYLQYELMPYFNLMMQPQAAFQYWRPNAGMESSYRGLFDYAPGAVMAKSPPLPSLGVPYIGYDMTPYYNLAPGCPLNKGSDDHTGIC